MSKKLIKLLTSIEVGEGILHGGREYELAADQADEFVKKRLAVYVNPKGADAKSAAKEMGAKDEPSQAKWAAAAIPGDHFNWQVRIKLPLLAQPFINPDFADPDLAEPGERKKRQYLEEIGGDGESINAQQARMIAFTGQIFRRVPRRLGGERRRRSGGCDSATEDDQRAGRRTNRSAVDRDRSQIPRRGRIHRDQRQLHVGP